MGAVIRSYIDRSRYLGVGISLSLVTPAGEWEGTALGVLLLRGETRAGMPLVSGDLRTNGILEGVMLGDFAVSTAGVPLVRGELRANGFLVGVAFGDFSLVEGPRPPPPSGIVGVATLCLGVALFIGECLSISDCDDGENGTDRDANDLLTAINMSFFSVFNPPESSSVPPRSSILSSSPSRRNAHCSNSVAVGRLSDSLLKGVSE